MSGSEKEAQLPAEDIFIDQTGDLFRLLIHPVEVGRETALFDELNLSDKSIRFSLKSQNRSETVDALDGIVGGIEKDFPGGIRFKIQRRQFTGTWICFFSFIIICGITMLNLLIAILVDVVINQKKL